MSNGEVYGKVLIVDDTVTNVDILVEALSGHYEISVATDAETALQLMYEDAPDLMLLDVMMPGTSGFDLLKDIRARHAELIHIPVIFLTALTDPGDKTRGFELGAVDYITKPFNIMEVKARVKAHVSLKKAREDLRNQNVILEQMVQERTRELNLTQEVTIESLAALAEYRDPETGGHIRRTKQYVRALAFHLSGHPRFRDALTPENIEWLYKSAPLHDIGKVGIPDTILNKPGSLTAEEFERIKLHTVYGRDTIHAARRKLGDNSFLRFAEEIAYTHHERYDGSGYPRGIRGDEIPIAGRIMALADIYDALISKRVYRGPIRHREAVRIISTGDGRTMPSHFDPDVLGAFLALEDAFKETALANVDCDEERASLLRTD